MNLKTAMILAAAVAVIAVLVAWSTAKIMPSGPHAEFSGACEESLNTVVDWAIAEMERQGGSVSYTQRTTIVSRVPLACACVRDKLAATIADDKWALAGQLTAIKFKAELAAVTQNQIVHAHTEAEARSELKRLMSDGSITAADIAALSQNIDSNLKTCFRQHFSEP